jgi:hypothetical protein
MLVIQHHHLFLNHKYAVEREAECLFSRCDTGLLLKCIGPSYFAAEREIEVACKSLYVHAALQVFMKPRAPVKCDSLWEAEKSSDGFSPGFLLLHSALDSTSFFPLRI